MYMFSTIVCTLYLNFKIESQQDFRNNNVKQSKHIEILVGNSGVATHAYHSNILTYKVRKTHLLVLHRNGICQTEKSITNERVFSKDLTSDLKYAFIWNFTSSFCTPLQDQTLV